MWLARRLAGCLSSHSQPVTMCWLSKRERCDAIHGTRIQSGTMWYNLWRFHCRIFNLANNDTYVDYVNSIVLGVFLDGAAVWGRSLHTHKQYTIEYKIVMRSIEMICNAWNNTRDISHTIWANRYVSYIQCKIKGFFFVSGRDNVDGCIYYTRRI